MRLWSLHPKYLDPAGLVALWRETLLAQKVLTGNTKGYKNHPQLLRFKEYENSLEFIGLYLEDMWKESVRRDYNFNRDKIIVTLPRRRRISVTSGQLKFELDHLKRKLKIRSREHYLKLLKVGDDIETHPIFKKIEGPIESWEVL